MEALLPIQTHRLPRKSHPKCRIFRPCPLEALRHRRAVVAAVQPEAPRPLQLRLWRWDRAGVAVRGEIREEDHRQVVEEDRRQVVAVVAVMVEVEEEGVDQVVAVPAEVLAAAALAQARAVPDQG